MTTAKLIDAAQERGLITPAQREQLLTLERELQVEPGSGLAEARGGFHWVNAAYLVGAIFVLYAFGWFLVKRWAALGPVGVLSVTGAYGALFVGAARWLQHRGFARAAALATVLTVGLTPLATWALLSLTGEWPPLDARDPLLRYDAFMSTRWLIVDLTTVLVGLVVLRRTRDPLLTLPVAVALWWALFHLDQAIGPAWESLGYQRWIMVANSLAVIAIAEWIERWQRRERAVRQGFEGDFAGAFWFVGLLGFAVSYLALWGHLDEGKHSLALVAAGIVALSVVLKRRVVFAFGLMGVVGYLAYLAEDVFATGVAFPLVLAAIGVGTIAVTVWLQKRYRGLFTGGLNEQASTPLPWSWPMACLPVGFAAAMAFLALLDAPEERAQRDFQQRLAILRGHSGSMRGRARPESGQKGAAGGSTASDSVGTGRVPLPDPTPPKP